MQRQEMIDKLHNRLHDWNQEIDKLEEKANVASANAKAEYRESIEHLRARKEQAKTRINELQHASDDAWDDIKQGAEQALTSLKEAYDSAKQKF
ncbi:sll1863 family stress response protein [Salinivibrio sharmensis]|uniref:Coiled coil domain-containing protein n=1 Tax=Salinivibrio sharmensis TaxID=390883 RepID=A0ABX3KIS8_9GAMM|nr:hypothetical protein [Salinivibrio sharmensis]OOE89348.1 hypothetical protein BZG74_05800 [Salinivibrio sharmensis]